MNERMAESQGLQFTGIYKRDKEEVKQRIAEERAKRPKARIILVTVPDSPLSRGGRGTGYSAYADSVYFAYDIRDSARGVIDGKTKAIEYLKGEYEKKLIEVENRFQQAVMQLQESDILIGEVK